MAGYPVLLALEISNFSYEVTCKTYPQHAASTMAIQKASVKDVLRNISP